MRTRTLSILDLSSSDAAAWRDLASRSVEPNPFYDVDFMVPACRHLRDGKNVALMVAEDMGRFYACLPVRRTTLLGGLSLPVISSWRHEYGFLGTPLVAPERGVEALRSILAGMRGSGARKRIVVLETFGDNGPIGANLRRAAEELGLTVHVYSSGERAVFRCQDQKPDALSPRIKRELRSKARQWRRLCGDWGTPTLVDRAQSRDSAAEFLAMEASGWKGRARTALASRPSDAAFYREVTDRFRASGKLRLYTLEVGGKTLAMQTNLCAGSALFDWKVAYDEDFARYGPGVQLQLRVLEQACQDGLSWIDSCSEVTDDHQLRLSPARRRIATLAIGREGRLARWALSFGVLLAKLRRQLAGFSVRTARYELSEASRVIARRVPVIVARGRLRERGDEAQEKPVRLGGRRAWFPIQAGYNPHPWWKFEHLRRAHPVLMPLWKRHYPVGADIAPPADVEALARWMDRWGLLPGQLTASTVRRQLEALVSAPVESITADVAPAVGSRDGLRLPAEWEPTEAVVLTWPVLYPGLWDFYSELVAAVAPVARVDVLIPDAIYAPAVRAYLGEAWHEDARLRCLVTASDDIWVRDYGPLTCLDGGGRRVMVDAIFDPPPAMPFANDDAFPARYAAHEGIPCCDLALHLEGGNLWSDGRGTIITTEGLFARNPHLPSEEVRRRLLDALGAETLIVVPRLRMEDTGHVDVFVKLATPETVLVTEPRSLVNRRRLTLTAELLASSRTAAGERYRVVRLPSVPHYRNWGVVRVWPNYANSLTVNGRVLVPTYGDPARDAAALDVYQQAMPGHEIIAIDAHVVANAGGTVHCLTMQIPAAQS